MRRIDWLVPNSDFANSKLIRVAQREGARHAQVPIGVGAAIDIALGVAQAGCVDLVEHVLQPQCDDIARARCVPR